MDHSPTDSIYELRSNQPSSSNKLLFLIFCCLRNQLSGCNRVSCSIYSLYASHIIMSKHFLHSLQVLQFKLFKNVFVMLYIIYIQSKSKIGHITRTPCQTWPMWFHYYTRSIACSELWRKMVTSLCICLMDILSPSSFSTFHKLDWSIISP